MKNNLTPQNIAFVACEVFRSEIEMLLSALPPVYKIRWLEMSQHDRPAELNKNLQAIIDEIETDLDVDAIALAYGLCGNAIIGLHAARVPIVVPRAHDCIGILLGGNRPHEEVKKTHSRCYWYSPGWIRGGKTPCPDYFEKMRAHYDASFEPDEVKELMDAMRSQYEVYREAIYIDTGASSKDADLAHTQTAARDLGWEKKVVAADMNFLRELLSCRWDTERFLVVSPGQKIASSISGDEVVKSNFERKTQAEGKDI